MTEKVYSPTDYDWATAIAARIADEIHLEDSGDKLVLYDVLRNALKNDREQMRRLIGTEIIEETYFESLQ